MLRKRYKVDQKISGKRSYIFVSAISIFLILALVFAIGELYARANHKRCYLTGLMTKNAVFHHLPPPYYNGRMYSDNDFDVSYVTNNRGMRGPGDYIYEKKEGLFRIAVLGDSFAFGVGVRENQTMSFQLEKMLNASGSGKYQVYNFGVSSFSTLLEYIYLKKEVIKYSPDLVIIMFDISDVQDDYYYQPHIVYDKKGNIIGCNPMMIGKRPAIRSYLMYYSRFFNLLDRTIIQSFRKMKTLGFNNYFSNKFKGIRNKTEIFKRKDINNIYFDKFIMFREGKNRAILTRHRKRSEEYLEMIKKYLKQREIPLVVIIYPYGHQVGEKQWQRGRMYWAFEQNRVYDASDGFEAIESFANEKNVPIINLYKAFKKRKDDFLYFDSDGHWTSLGQQIAAQAVFDSDIFKDAIKHERR